MRKELCFVFVLLIFVASAFVPLPQIRHVVEGDNYELSTQYGVFDSVPAKRVSASTIYIENKKYDKAIYNTSDVSLSKLIDLLGINVLSVENVKGNIEIKGISKFIGGETKSVEISAGGRYIIVGAPKII